MKRAVSRTLRGCASSHGISTAIEGDEETILERLAAIERLLQTIQRIDPMAGSGALTTRTMHSKHSHAS